MTHVRQKLALGAIGPFGGFHGRLQFRVGLGQFPGLHRQPLAAVGQVLAEPSIAAAELAQPQHHANGRQSQNERRHGNLQTQLPNRCVRFIARLFRHDHPALIADGHRHERGHHDLVGQGIQILGRGGVSLNRLLNRRQDFVFVVLARLQIEPGMRRDRPRVVDHKHIAASRPTASRYGSGGPRDSTAPYRFANFKLASAVGIGNRRVESPSLTMRVDIETAVNFAEELPRGVPIFRTISERAGMSQSSLRGGGCQIPPCGPRETVLVHCRAVA